MIPIYWSYCQSLDTRPAPGPDWSNVDPDSLVSLAERLRKAGVSKICLSESGDPTTIEFFAEDPLGLGKLDEQLGAKTTPEAESEKRGGVDAALRRMAGRAAS